MLLQSVRIQNFRSIIDETISFTPQCRVLVGINESGKTNVLQALALLDPNREISPDDIRESLPNENPNAPALVHFLFIIEAAEIDQIYKNIRARFYGDESQPIATFEEEKIGLKRFCHLRNEAIYEINLRTKNRRLVGYTLPKSYGPTEGWVKPVKTWQISLPGIKGVASAPASSFIGVHKESFDQIPIDCEPLSAEDVNIAFLTEFAIVCKNRIPACIYWEYSAEHLLPCEIALSDFVANPKICLPLLRMFELARYTDPSNAIQEAQARKGGLKNLLRKVSTIATKHIHGVWKDYKKVQLELSLNGDYINAAVRDAYNEFDFSRRSDGFKRFVTFLLLVSASAKTRKLVNTLYLQDEPDGSLHPSGARYLRDELINISSTNYVVYSTHSIFMIDREEIGRHLIVRKNKEVTTLEQVSSSNVTDEEVINNAIGYSVFESIKKVNIIFEGWKDKQLFKTALRNDPRAFFPIKPDEIGMCHSRGVKVVQQVAAMIELANRTCLVISDSDQPAREHQKDYKGPGKWMRYDQLAPLPEVITAEDFLKDDFLYSVFDSFEKEHGFKREASDRFQARGGKLLQMRQWLSKRINNNDQVKKCVDALKAKMFETLTNRDIEISYSQVLKSVASEIKILEAL